MPEFLFPDWLEDPPLAEEPTTALPGTPQKISVLESRLRRNDSLWHPSDAVNPDERAKLVRRLRNGRTAHVATVEKRHGATCV
jgi:hypothetical protein